MPAAATASNAWPSIRSTKSCRAAGDKAGASRCLARTSDLAGMTAISMEAISPRRRQLVHEFKRLGRQAPFVGVGTHHGVGYHNLYAERLDLRLRRRVYLVQHE